MKKKKSFWIVIALLVISLTITGCGGTKTTTEATPNTGDDQAIDPEAANFPNKPITIVVPWGPGGRTDTWIRAIAIPMEKHLGVPVVVTNQPGGVGVVGAIAVAESDPDGYTIGPYCTAHYLASFLKTPPFEPEAYDPIAMFTDISYVIVVAADAPWDNFIDLVEYAKENPGKVKHGNTGTGTEDHVYASYLYNVLGLDMQQFPYAGDSGAITALLSGEIDVSMMAVAPAMPQILSGDLKALAVSSVERMDFLPDVPTFKEQGIDFTESAWTGLFVPKGTDPAIIEKLRQSVEYACNDAEFRKVMEGLYSPIVYKSGADLEQQINETLAKLDDWIKRILDAGIDLGI
jgi:tripartite-type tricarboxylate transporter receptor subunit TctC